MQSNNNLMDISYVYYLHGQLRQKLIDFFGVSGLVPSFFDGVIRPMDADWTVQKSRTEKGRLEAYVLLSSLAHAVHCYCLGSTPLTTASPQSWHLPGARLVFAETLMQAQDACVNYAEELAKAEGRFFLKSFELSHTYLFELLEKYEEKQNG